MTMVISIKHVMVLASYLCFVYATLNHSNHEWCKYQLCMDKKNWYEAKAACEFVNKTLLKIMDSSHYDYVRSLITESIASLTRPGYNIERTLWIGLHDDRNGVKRWSDCELYDNNCIPVDYRTTGCYVMNPDSCPRFMAADCSEKKQFICKGKDEACFKKGKNENVFIIKKEGNEGTKLENELAYSCSVSCTAYGSTGDLAYLFYPNGEETFFRSIDDFRTKELLYYNEIIISSPVPATDLCVTNSHFEDSLAATNTPEVFSTIKYYFHSTVTGTRFTHSLVSSIITETITQTVTEYVTDSSTINPTLASTYTPVSYTCFNVTNITMTDEELRAEIKKLRDQLIVKKKNLSSWKRTLVSAKDDRITAKGIGYVAVVILGIVAVLIISLDSSRFLTSIKILKKQITGKSKTTESKILATPTLPLEPRRRLVFLDDASC